MSTTAGDDTPVPLTVDQLRALLEEASASGHGDCPVMLPYDPGYSTMGSRAMLPLVALDLGFDWEANKVLLRLPQSVSVRDAELRARMDRQYNALMKIRLAISKLGDETLFPIDEQVDTFKKNMVSIIDRGLSDPAKLKPRSPR